jgi:hypothetical protein
MSDTTSHAVPARGDTVLFAVLAIVTVGAFLPLWHNEFVDLDDDRYITANPFVLGGPSREGIVEAWTSFRGNYWQPLSWMSLQLDAAFFSTKTETGENIPNPAAFHLHSLCWHVASVLLLFAVLQRTTGARWRSFLVAALFAVHPMRVESVAWAAERKDVLSVFFGVLTLWVYVRYVEKRSAPRYLAVIAAYALSLLSKPMLMTLPFVLLLLDYWPLRRTSLQSASSQDGTATVRQLFLEKLPLFVMAAGIAIVTEFARAQTGSAVPLSELSLTARLANALAAYASYLADTFFPLRLAVMYPHPLENWSVNRTLAGAAVLLIISAVSVLRWRQWPWLAVGWFWFVVALLPVIGFFQGGPQARADRFCYWPHIGLFVAVVWGLGAAVERWRVPALISGAVGATAVVCLAVITWMQVGYWHDPLTLWTRDLSVTEENAEAHQHLGKYYLERGQLDDARAHFKEAARIEPRSARHQRFLTTTLLRLRKSENGIDRPDPD